MPAYAGVECTDSPHPVGADAYQNFAAGLIAASPFLGGSIANELLPCAFWPVPVHDVTGPVVALRMGRRSWWSATRDDAITPYPQAVDVDEHARPRKAAHARRRRPHRGRAQQLRRRRRGCLLRRSDPSGPRHGVQRLATPGWGCAPGAPGPPSPARLPGGRSVGLSARSRNLSRRLGFWGPSRSR